MVEADNKYQLQCSVCGSNIQVKKVGIFLKYTCPECGVLNALEYEEQEVDKPKRFTSLA